jgi:hypothetical protein
MKRLALKNVLLAALAELTFPTLAAQLTPVDSRWASDLFVWTDTCNVYVLRDGDAALLIDLGSSLYALYPLHLALSRQGVASFWVEAAELLLGFDVLYQPQTPLSTPFLYVVSSLCCRPAR